MYFKVWSAHIYWYYLVLEVYSWEIFTALHHIYDLVMNINIFMNFLMMMNKKYFAFSYGDEQERIILLPWLPIEYMFGKRDIAWPI